METKNVFISSLVGGGVAGFAVDVTLFPLDTLKTRLQAAQGFRKAGGFQGIYKGLGPQAIGSVPQAALFFCTYETFKHFLIPMSTPQTLPLVYMAGASIAEIVACLIRVPIEIAKQRRQTTVGTIGISSYRILRNAYNKDGLFRGLYRGFWSTVFREIPFSAIQFLILEYLKAFYNVMVKDETGLSSWDVALCGSIAGGIAAGVTTPFDVIKTRIMLADSNFIKTDSLTMRNMARLVYRERGLRGLFAGFVPRVLFITLGGAVFFGMYDLSKTTCSNIIESRRIENLSTT